MTENLLIDEIRKLAEIAARTAYNSIIQKTDIQTLVRDWVITSLSQDLVISATAQLQEKMQELDLKNLTERLLQERVDQCMQELIFPPGSINPESINWKRREIDFPKNSIHPHSIDWRRQSMDAAVITGQHKNFHSAGISDLSTNTQLTVTEQGVVLGNLISDNIMSSGQSFLKDVTTEGTLSIQADLSLAEPARAVLADLWQSEYQAQLARTSSWDLTDRSIIANDRQVLTATSLGPGVQESNLRRLGNLLELNVMGDSNLADVMYVNQAGRVSINSPEATGALTIWDEDAELSIYKHSQKTMYVGTNRLTDLILGTHNQDQIKLTTDGDLEFTGRIRWSGRLFSISDAIPEHQGEPGEIVLVNDEIYSCRGGNKWQKIA
jgi:hypothetical protein